MNQLSMKENIMIEAIHQFNYYGINNVNNESIGKVLNISIGNINDNYNTKEDLLIEIFEKMNSELNSYYEKDQILGNPLFHLNLLFENIESLQEEYSFFNLDLLEISRNYKKVKVLLDKTFQLRAVQTKKIFKNLIENDYLDKTVSKEEYTQLIHSIRILITFWKSQEEVLKNYSSTKQNMSRSIWQLIKPYLTKKGLKSYKQIITKELV